MKKKIILLTTVFVMAVSASASPFWFLTSCGAIGSDTEFYESIEEIIEDAIALEEACDNQSSELYE